MFPNLLIFYLVDALCGPSPFIFSLWEWYSLVKSLPFVDSLYKISSPCPILHSNRFEWIIIFCRQCDNASKTMPNVNLHFLLSQAWIIGRTVFHLQWLVVLMTLKNVHSAAEPSLVTTVSSGISKINTSDLTLCISVSFVNEATARKTVLQLTSLFSIEGVLACWSAWWRVLLCLVPLGSLNHSNHGLLCPDWRGFQWLNRVLCLMKGVLWINLFASVSI